MSEGVFHFKQFSVNCSRSGLKVGTDGVILGACVSLGPEVRRVLDIGTGTGLIALMIAQRTAGNLAQDDADSCEILGIDIDADAAAEASGNFSASPWAGRLNVVNAPLQEFQSPSGVKYDLVVSNPPFFENSLKSPDAQRSAARHTDGLSYREIVSFSAANLASDGLLAMILPASQEISLVRYAASFGLYPSRVIRVKTTAAKAPKRIVVELGRKRCTVVGEGLVLMEDGSYTEQFRALTCNFYLR